MASEEGALESGKISEMLPISDNASAVEDSFGSMGSKQVLEREGEPSAAAAQSTAEADKIDSNAPVNIPTTSAQEQETNDEEKQKDMPTAGEGDGKSAGEDQRDTASEATVAETRQGSTNSTEKDRTKAEDKDGHVEAQQDEKEEREQQEELGGNLEAQFESKAEETSPDEFSAFDETENVDDVLTLNETNDNVEPVAETSDALTDQDEPVANITTEASKTEAAEAEAEEAEIEAAQTGAAQTEAAETEAAETETAETEAAETETAETEAAETEASETEAAETEAAEAGAAETEAAGTEAAGTEAAGTEAAETEAAESTTKLDSQDPAHLGSTSISEFSIASSNSDTVAAKDAPVKEKSPKSRIPSPQMKSKGTMQQAEATDKKLSVQQKRRASTRAVFEKKKEEDALKRLAEEEAAAAAIEVEREKLKKAKTQRERSRQLVLKKEAERKVALEKEASPELKALSQAELEGLVASEQQNLLDVFEFYDSGLRQVFKRYCMSRFKEGKNLSFGEMSQNHERLDFHRLYKLCRDFGIAHKKGLSQAQLKTLFVELARRGGDCTHVGFLQFRDTLVNCANILLNREPWVQRYHTLSERVRALFHRMDLAEDRRPELSKRMLAFGGFMGGDGKLGGHADVGVGNLQSSDFSRFDFDKSKGGSNGTEPLVNTFRQPGDPHTPVATTRAANGGRWMAANEAPSPSGQSMGEASQSKGPRGPHFEHGFTTGFASGFQRGVLAASAVTSSSGSPIGDHALPPGEESPVGKSFRERQQLEAAGPSGEVKMEAERALDVSNAFKLDDAMEKELVRSLGLEFQRHGISHGTSNGQASQMWDDIDYVEVYDYSAGASPQQGLPQHQHQLYNQPSKQASSLQQCIARPNAGNTNLGDQSVFENGSALRPVVPLVSEASLLLQQQERATGSGSTFDGTSTKTPAKARKTERADAVSHHRQQHQDQPHRGQRPSHHHQRALAVSKSKERVGLRAHGQNKGAANAAVPRRPNPNKSAGPNKRGSNTKSISPRARMAAAQEKQGHHHFTPQQHRQQPRQAQRQAPVEYAQQRYQHQPHPHSQTQQLPTMQKNAQQQAPRSHRKAVGHVRLAKQQQQLVKQQYSHSNARPKKMTEAYQEFYGGDAQPGGQPRLDISECYDEPGEESYVPANW